MVLAVLSVLALSFVYSSARVATDANAAGPMPIGLAQTAQATTGTITGVVTDEASKQPIEGAQVIPVGETVGTVTNVDGRYLLLNVPAGEHEIRVVLLGFAQQSHTVTVTAGKTATTDFTLNASAVQLSRLVVNSIAGTARLEWERGAYCEIRPANPHPGREPALAVEQARRVPRWCSNGLRHEQQRRSVEAQRSGAA